jgi:hypothetical protein
VMFSHTPHTSSVGMECCMSNVGGSEASMLPFPLRNYNDCLQSSHHMEVDLTSEVPCTPATCAAFHLFAVCAVPGHG